MTTNTTLSTDSAPALEIIDLRFRFPGASVDTLDIASLSLARAEQAVITGPSGTGKSTLLQIVAGLLDPGAGRVNVGGRNIHALAGASRDLYRGKTIGMIFQTFNLLHGFSALENVMAALMFSDVPTREHKPRAEALLKQLGIERVNATPDELSVGQQQRVAVARAVVTEPALVLADEPTASLDPDNAKAAIELIRGVCARTGAALLCVSHDPLVAQLFDRRIALQRPAARV